MQGNLHVRFGVGVGVKLPGLHHRKTLTPEQKSQAADTFGAEGEFLSAGKKLLDTRHPAFKAVTAARGRMLSFWKGISLPYPEPGIRLIGQNDIGSFDVQMTTLKAELDEAVEKLDEHYGELRLGGPRSTGQALQPDRLSAVATWTVCRQLGFSEHRAAAVLAAAQPATLRTGVSASAGPFRRSGSTRRASIHG